MRILFDANILLDVLLRRQPLAQESARLVNAVEAQQITGLLGATTVTTVYYLIARHANEAAADQSVEHLLRLFEVASVGRAVLEDALRLGFGDYEDAVQHESARHAGADGIVTRNTKDFSRASLAIYTPAELLQFI